MDYKAIGVRLQQKRKELKISQLDVAENLGMRQADISEMENGRSRSIEMFEAYGRYLQIPFKQLLFPDNQKEELETLDALVNMSKQERELYISVSALPLSHDLADLLLDMGCPSIKHLRDNCEQYAEAIAQKLESQDIENTLNVALSEWDISYNHDTFDVTICLSKKTMVEILQGTITNRRSMRLPQIHNMNALAFDIRFHVSCGNKDLFYVAKYLASQFKSYAKRLDNEIASLNKYLDELSNMSAPSDSFASKYIAVLMASEATDSELQREITDTIWARTSYLNYAQSVCCEKVEKLTSNHLYQFVDTHIIAPIRAGAYILSFIHKVRMKIVALLLIGSFLIIGVFSIIIKELKTLLNLSGDMASKIAVGMVLAVVAVFIAYLLVLFIAKKIIYPNLSDEKVESILEPMILTKEKETEEIYMSLSSVNTLELLFTDEQS